MASDRDFDVLLYGAGGFTGRQTVAYFTKHAPPGLRWAIAGPRRHTLDAARQAAGAALVDDALFVAPSQDQAAVDAAVARARVVLNTAGPFALYGTPIVDACVRLGTHYVDITGETPWMREIAATYHQRAADAGTAIVPACGFDSVPSDLGAMLMARAVRETLAVDCTEVRAYFRFSGGLNGGTVASLLNMLEAPSRRGHDARRERRDPRIRLVTSPRYDPERGAWIGPFVMAPTNTYIVARSLRLSDEWHQPYGPRERYQEAMQYDPPLARARAVAASAGLGLLFAGLKHPLTRRAIRPLLPSPGTGPSAQAMDRGWFTCDLLAFGEDGRQLRGVISFEGDPGNRATTVFVCESALTLALRGSESGRAGVLTPATALGESLVQRLSRAGVRLETGSPARLGNEGRS